MVFTLALIGFVDCILCKNEKKNSYLTYTFESYWRNLTFDSFGLVVKKELLHVHLTKYFC